MSVEAAKKFVEKVCSDESFAKGLGQHKDLQDFCNSPAAQKEGFSFSKDDLSSVTRELTEQQKENLRCHTEDCNWLGG